MLWKVRFKFRQMMHEHVLETITDEQAEADELAEHYIGEKFGSPNVRVVPPIEPFVALRSREVPALALKYGPIAPTGTPMPATPPIAEPSATPAPPAVPAVPDPVPEPAPTPMTAEEADAADEDAMAPRVPKGATPKPGSKQRIGA